MHPEFITRFWSRVNKDGDCWLWAGALQPTGYGKVYFEGVMHGAHRIAWRITHGPIPDGLCVCHRCDNPTCVNPEHLFLGTQRQNMSDMVRKGRSVRGDHHWTRTRPDAVLSGDSHYASKLTADDVREIRRRYAAGGVFYRELAAEYGVKTEAIYKIVRRRAWKHVE